jgi:hypothetical protein
VTGKDFLRSVSNGKVDFLELTLGLLKDTGCEYCVIGGLAVNAYAEPVVSLDLDLVVVSARVAELTAAALAAGMKVEELEHSINLSIPASDLRIQLRKDPRYQEFIPRAVRRNVLGYHMPVASLDDVVTGKLWAFEDTTRRGSKRQKDLADIMRLVETHPHLGASLPASIRSVID